jgi:hypothetical protein
MWYVSHAMTKRFLSLVIPNQGTTSQLAHSAVNVGHLRTHVSVRAKVRQNAGAVKVLAVSWTSVGLAVAQAGIFVLLPEVRHLLARGATAQESLTLANAMHAMARNRSDVQHVSTVSLCAQFVLKRKNWRGSESTRPTLDPHLQE